MTPVPDVGVETTGRASSRLNRTLTVWTPDGQVLAALPRRTVGDIRMLRAIWRLCDDDLHLLQFSVHSW